MFRLARRTTRTRHTVLKRCVPLRTTKILPHNRISLFHTSVPKFNLQSQESFIDGTSATYVEQMYNAWIKDPQSVHVSWASYFSNIVAGLPPGQAYSAPPSLGGAVVKPTGVLLTTSTLPAQAGDAASLKQLRLSVQVQAMIRAYQVMGHNIARIDPLGLMERKEPTALRPDSYGITESDMDVPVSQIKSEGITLGFVKDNQPMTVRQVLTALKKSYCDTIGVEYMHIQDRAQCNWLRERIENRENTYVPSSDDRKNTHNRLAWATYFEEFCHKKFTDRR